MSQQDEVLRYMKQHRRGITSRIAIDQFNVFRLADVIFKLKGKGHKIIPHLIPNKTNSAKHARYVLAS